LNLGSSQGRNAGWQPDGQAELRLAGWQSAAALLARPSTPNAKCLVFGASLELGAWNLELLSTKALYTHFPLGENENGAKNQMVPP